MFCPMMGNGIPIPCTTTYQKWIGQPTHLAGSKNPTALAMWSVKRREEEIVVLLINGATNGEIAEALTILESTARFHVSNALRKTDCHTRNDIVHKFRHS